MNEVKSGSKKSLDGDRPVSSDGDEASSFRRQMSLARSAAPDQVLPRPADRWRGHAPGLGSAAFEMVLGVKSLVVVPRLRR